MAETETNKRNSSPRARRSAGVLVLVLVGACALAATTATTAASAEGARVVDAGRKVEGASFSADASAGRAWVVATIARRFASGKEARAPGARVPVSVEGLGYDATSAAIVYVDDRGTRSTCARLLRGKTVATGACRIVATIEPRAVDTGFEVVTRDHVVVRIAPAR